MKQLVRSAADFLSLRGDIAIVTRRVSDGSIVRRQLIRNTITFDGMVGVLQLWDQTEDPANYQIDTLRVGSGSIPPTREDVGLVTPVASKPVSRSVSVSSRELVLTMTLDDVDANGSTLTEVGWFYANGRMGGRQVHAPVAKTSGITVSYSWRLGVTT